MALAEAFNEMLDRLEGERRDSGRRALAAQEAERRRIARELHDEIGQLLTGLILRGETLARRAPEELRADVVGLREGAREAAEEVRLIARRLRPEALDELGLQSALLALCTSVAERARPRGRAALRPRPAAHRRGGAGHLPRRPGEPHQRRPARAAPAAVTLTLEADGDRGVVLVVARRRRGPARRGARATRAGSAACASGRCSSARSSSRRCRRAARHRGARCGCRRKDARMTTPLVTRVLLADDHPIVRNGLRELLEQRARLPRRRRGRRRGRGGRASARRRRRPGDPGRHDAAHDRPAGGARARVAPARAARSSCSRCTRTSSSSSRRCAPGRPATCSRPPPTATWSTRAGRPCAARRSCTPAPSARSCASTSTRATPGVAGSAHAARARGRQARRRGPHERRDRRDALHQPQDGRPPPREHPREARHARPRRPTRYAIRRGLITP